MTTVLAIYAAWLLIAVLVWFFFGPSDDGHSIAWLAWTYCGHRAKRRREINDQLAADDQQLPRPLDDADRRGFGEPQP